ncbi:MAG: heat-inducible transcription repressor HrcA [Acidimicrobiaceae bacterium]|nr:heat-inducible transcription repressor HrcA [Acidimicrobiaceae bacterium]
MVDWTITTNDSGAGRQGSDQVRRRKEIIRAVVDEYVKTAEPVGSAHVVRASGLTASPATIRNDMAQLEQDGYLSQPHVSAGRVPTDKGYRYYVDQMAGSHVPDEGLFTNVQRFFQLLHGELAQTLAAASQLVSSLTQYTSIVTAVDPTSTLIKHIQLVDIGHGSVLMVVVGASGKIDKFTIEFSDPPLEDQLVTATNFLNSKIRNSGIETLPRALESTGDFAVDVIVCKALEQLGNTLAGSHEELLVNAASKTASAFDAVEKVTKLLQTLEQEYLVVSLVKSMVSRRQAVSIGNETGVESLADCALVLAPFDVDGKRAGSIGILGPSRMDYPLALSTVTIVGERLGQHLSED